MQVESRRQGIRKRRRWSQGGNASGNAFAGWIVAGWVVWRFGLTLARVTGWCSWWVAWAYGSQGGYSTASCSGIRCGGAGTRSDMC
jgi:hypothetical protein